MITTTRYAGYISDAVYKFLIVGNSIPGPARPGVGASWVKGISVVDTPDLHQPPVGWRGQVELYV
jgi:hypothetical protein